MRVFGTFPERYYRDLSILGPCWPSHNIGGGVFLHALKNSGANSKIREEGSQDFNILTLLYTYIHTHIQTRQHANTPTRQHANTPTRQKRSNSIQTFKYDHVDTCGGIADAARGQGAARAGCGPLLLLRARPVDGAVARLGGRDQ